MLYLRQHNSKEGIMSNGAVAIVVIGTTVTNNKERLYNIVLLDKNYNPMVQSGCTEDMVCNFVVQNKLKPLNFDVDFDRKNKNKYIIVESNGSFSRLAQKTKGVPVLVICSMYVNEFDRILSYVVVDTTGCVYNIQAQELYSRCMNYKKRFDASLVQNGIFKLKDDKVPFISAYPNKQFVKIVMKSRVKNSVIDKTAEKNKTAVKDNLKRNTAYLNNNKTTFDAGQDKQLKLAAKYGVNPLLISNPNLSSDQMKILWRAKHNGIQSGYFADPNLPADTMRFFASKLVSDKVCKECLGLINPDYNLDQLNELYMGICTGIDFRQYADPKMSAVDMNIKRMRLENEQFYKKNPTKKKVFHDGYFERVGELEFTKTTKGK